MVMSSGILPRKQLFVCGGRRQARVDMRNATVALCAHALNPSCFLERCLLHVTCTNDVIVTVPL
eukprot:scaffold88226_cov26-Tisochrysis_lutea.AAC.1